MLAHLIEPALRLLHPVIPFITEELWTALTGGTTIVTAAWPGERAGGAEAQPARDPAAEAEIGSLMALVTEVRRFRSDQGLRLAVAGPRRAERDRRHAAGRPRGRHPLAAAADRSRRRLQPDRVPGRRGGHGRAGHGGHD